MFTDRQIHYALNSISNLPSNRVGNAGKLEATAKELLEEIFSNAKIINLIGKWKLVWGPKVYEHKPGLFGVADNAMYVAQRLSDPKQFVVAISGTNPISKYGWQTEDGDITPPVAWPYQTSVGTGKITNGTSVGMNVLLNELKDDGLSLFKYLANQVANCRDPLTVTVTGHSLGGALSPVTALALLDSQGVSLDKSNGWDPQSKSQISVMPTAGPTPGDEEWRDYYDRRLGAKTDRVWNKIDIVPHAWQISMMNEILSIYESTTKPKIQPPSDKITTTVKKAIKNSQTFQNKAGSPLMQICPSVEGFPGERVDLGNGKDTFLQQAVYQHTTAYSKFLGTTYFDEIVKQIENKKMIKPSPCNSCSIM